MRICFVVSQFAPLIGGTEGQIRELAAGLASRGHAVEVVTQAVPGRPSRERVDGITVARAIRGIRIGPLFGPTYWLSLALALAHRRAADLFQIAFAHWEAAVAGWLRGLLNRPVVVRVANTEAGGDLGRMQTSRYWPLYQGWDRPTVGQLIRGVQRCDAFVVAASPMAASLRREGFPEGRIIEIPNGVDHRRFRPPTAEERAAARAGLSVSGRVVTAVSRLEPWKGMRDLVSALALLPQDTHLVFVGDGSERTALQAQAQDLGLRERLHVMGWTGDVLPHLWAADAFVLASRTEGMPNALLEAMATGLPCVATDVGAVSKLLDGGAAGVLIPPGNPPTLATALNAVLRQPGEAARLGAAARARIEAQFTADQMLGRYEALYETLTRQVAG